jgi:hypothetical protein
VVRGGAGNIMNESIDQGGFYTQKSCMNFFLERGGIRGIRDRYRGGRECFVILGFQLRLAPIFFVEKYHNLVSKTLLFLAKLKSIKF